MMHRCSIFLTNDGPLAARGRRVKPKFLPKFFSLLRSLTRFFLKQPPSGMSVATRTGRNVLKNTLTIMTTATTGVSRNHKCCAWGERPNYEKASTDVRALYDLRAGVGRARAGSGQSRRAPLPTLRQARRPPRQARRPRLPQ